MRSQHFAERFAYFRVLERDIHRFLREVHGLQADQRPVDVPARLQHLGAALREIDAIGLQQGLLGEAVFDNCRVPAANLVGGENAGVKVVMSGLDLERAMIAPLCLGIAERALELSLDYARTRQQFGQPIASFQMIQDKLAQMYVWVESMRLFTYQALRAASALEHGEIGRGEIHKLSAASVMFAANTMNSVLDEAVQIHGGSGYIWESEVNRLYRSIKLLEIGAGTTEVRKIIISGEMLRG